MFVSMIIHTQVCLLTANNICSSIGRKETEKKKSLVTNTPLPHVWCWTGCSASVAIWRLASRQVASLFAVSMLVDVKCAGVAVILILEFHALALCTIVSSTAISTSRCTKCVEFSGLCKIGGRLDKGAAVVAHGLIPGLWVLGSQSSNRRPKAHGKDDKGKDDVDNEEEDTHDANCQ